MARGIKPLIEMAGRATLGIGSVVGAGVEAALLAWDRRSELSADRAALLTMQDPRPCISMLMKLAGGTERHVEWLDAQQFLNQARTYKEGLDQSMSDRFYKFLVNVRADHPFAVERARTLDEWVNGKEYNDILLGNHRTPSTVPVKVRFCPTCGWQASPEDMFCFTDGTPLPR